MFVYVKINKNYAISKKKYFQIGNIIFHVEPYVNSGIKISIHNNEIRHNSKSRYEEHFYDRTSTHITIGRSENCNIKIKNSILSKIQCTLYYEDCSQNWFIKDGNGERYSMNGTWLLCNSKYELSEEETKCKIGKSIIKIKKILV